MMHKQSVLGMLLFSMVSFSAYSETSPADYCISRGGNLVDFVQLNERRQETKIKKVFCQFINRGEGTKTVATETLANPRLTMAVGFFRNPVDQKELRGSPAYAYCTTKLKGLYSNWRNLETGDESGSCALSDGSMMSDWAFVYGAKRLPKLDGDFAYQAPH